MEMVSPIILLLSPVLLLSSAKLLPFAFLARYAGPIKTTTKWTIGAEIELPTSSTFKSTTNPISPFGPTTTSAELGQSAHIFSNFPTLMSGDPSRATFGADTRESEGESGSTWDESGVEEEGEGGFEEGEGEEVGRRRWGCNLDGMQEEEEGVGVRSQNEVKESGRGP